MPAEAREVWGSSFMCVIELRSDSKLSKLSKSPMSHWENIQGEGIKLWRYWIVPIPPAPQCADPPTGDVLILGSASHGRSTGGGGGGGNP